MLSAVVPARNSASWIAELLQSISQQAVAELEVLVVVNGSSDGTAEIVQGFVDRDPRFRLIPSSSASAAESRNHGIAAACGEYLVFADSDDIIPDGAYRAMLDSLQASGSDMVIGDHLKFSPTNTWSPTRRWHPFDEHLQAIDPSDVPQLLSGRPCWNRMFRRSFWDRAGLRFPEVPSVEDIEPMTRAFVTAQRIDVVRECVYLYRDRGDASSLSLHADAAVTVRYLEQELACAALVRDVPSLRAQHAEIVLDADGWAHLHRFLTTDPADDEVAEVARATETLLSALPPDALATVAPSRRVLWELVTRNEWDTARSFVLGTASATEQDRIGAWCAAVHRLKHSDLAVAEKLAVDGLVPALVNGADQVDPSSLGRLLTGLVVLTLEPTGNALFDALLTALRSENAELVSKVSALRRIVPLVVDRAEASAEGLTVGGPADLQEGGRARLHLTGATGEDEAIDVVTGADGWRADVLAAGTGAGRYSVTASFDGVAGRFPVVTARMALPPVAESLPMQPLADRKDGWRFLVDRRPEQRGRLGGFLGKVARKLR
ncbi:glycosyltransferase family 2 protein [Curtobacterium sp. 458]|uniref:glycosyltransferase family 2 protein n=1 Tax=Curtobacterium sp. 458 TaxID=3050069 RepID=UPI0025B3EFC8|nr:glycosyltransferase family 2 protein [Curtobacterium sp. 458]WJX99741.1 glycosyltransferase family 2 protein [Curtobacterium sp. 458]